MQALKENADLSAMVSLEYAGVVSRFGCTWIKAARWVRRWVRRWIMARKHR